MRIRAKHFLAGLSVVFLTLPVWAHTDSTGLEITKTTIIAGTQLNPGNYEFKVKDGASQVSVIRDGKVVAQVPCQWVQLPKRAEDSEVIFSDNQITEIDFGGQTEAVKFN
jgi:hypothetical protein